MRARSAPLGELPISYREGSKIDPLADGGVGAMDTRLLHLSQVTIQTGLESLADPIKPELFVGKHEGRWGTLVGTTRSDLHMRSKHDDASEFVRHSTRASDGPEHTLSRSTRTECPRRSA
jgi:hypothetical protein